MIADLLKEDFAVSAIAGHCIVCILVQAPVPCIQFLCKSRLPKYGRETRYVLSRGDAHNKLRARTFINKGFICLDNNAESSHVIIGNAYHVLCSRLLQP